MMTSSSSSSLMPLASSVVAMMRTPKAARCPQHLEERLGEKTIPVFSGRASDAKVSEVASTVLVCQKYGQKT